MKLGLVSANAEMVGDEINKTVTMSKTTRFSSGKIRAVMNIIKMLFLSDWFAAPSSKRQNICASSPRIPLRGHFFDALRVFRGEIVHFSAILLHVVKFPRFIFFGDQFPFSIANGAIGFMLPEYRTLALHVFPL